ncbi:MAG: signal recognition particle-docking protein FtsY [Acidobacteria bacterium]|nr:signal recognition particle-docking protein FtsY [Acidobacteriota bacterium]
MSIFNYKEQPGYFARLKNALTLTQEEIGKKIDQIVGKQESPITENQLEELENVLIGSDIGVNMTMEIIGRIREETRGQRIMTSFKVKRLIREELVRIFKGTQEWEEPGSLTKTPYIIFVVGVNGVGKTTTIAKLAHRYRSQGKDLLICASDTFRAAAVDQLMVWADRINTDVIRQSTGSDPAAVLFDAIAASRARNKEMLIVDTAGRLHTKSNLMQELQKMKRVAAREVEGAPHQVYLVLDATTGQNGQVQAQQFLNTIGITGLIVTKLDGTAKGGIVVSIARDLKLPIAYIGVGEKLEDLVPFSAEAFIDSLFPENEAGR